MSEIRTPTPWGYSVFCDDLRQETGGKFSLMGIYQGYMFLPEFPITIPKFCIFVSYVEEFDIDIPDLQLRLYLPGDPDDMPSITQVIPMTKGIAKPPTDHFDDPKLSVNIPLLFAPIEIKQAGTIKVRMKRGEDIVRLGSLYVAQATIPVAGA